MSVFMYINICKEILRKDWWASSFDVGNNYYYYYWKFMNIFVLLLGNLSIMIRKVYGGLIPLHPSKTRLLFNSAYHGIFGRNKRQLTEFLKG